MNNFARTLNALIAQCETRAQFQSEWLVWSSAAITTQWIDPYVVRRQSVPLSIPGFAVFYVLVRTKRERERERERKRETLVARVAVFSDFEIKNKSGAAHPPP